MKNEASLRINCRFWVCSFILKMGFLFWESFLSLWIGLYYKLIVAFCFHLTLPRCSFHLQEQFLLAIQSSVFLSPIWWVRFLSPSKVFRNLGLLFFQSAFYFLIWKKTFVDFFVLLSFESFLAFYQSAKFHISNEHLHVQNYNLTIQLWNALVALFFTFCLHWLLLWMEVLTMSL